MSEQNKPEGVRAWYDRTTRRSRKVFMIASMVSGVVMLCMWLFAPMPTLMRIQSFNGALTIPLVGGLWIFMFIFMFLVPSREASFRAQESIDKLHGEVAGAVEVWKAIGLEVQKELPKVLSEFRATIAEVRGAVATIREMAVKNEKFIEESKPAVEALKRIEERIEQEMKSGIVDDLRDMTKAVKNMAGVPVNGKKSEPDLGIALRSIGKKKEPV